MPVAVIYRVDTFTQGMFRGHGDVKVWMDRITKTFERHALHYAPERSGELRAGISSYSYTSGAHEVRAAIVSSAPHTMYVLRGTGYPGKGKAGYIYTTKGFVTRNQDDAYVTLWGIDRGDGTFSRRGKGRREQHQVRKKGYWLKLPADEEAGYKAGFRFRVHGQSANNFLLKAWKATASNHTAIRAPKVMIPGGISSP